MKALADHPVAWCKDFQGGRSFYTNVGANGDFAGADVRSHLAGAIQWTAGEADPVYSDCGATVLANYQQTKVSVEPEPQRADRLRHAARTAACCRRRAAAQLRLHDPKDGSSKVDRHAAGLHQQRGRPLRPGDRQRLRRPTSWVYLYYAPQTVVNVKQSDGTTQDDHDAAEQLGADRPPRR